MQASEIEGLTAAQRLALREFIASASQEELELEIQRLAAAAREKKRIAFAAAPIAVALLALLLAGCSLNSEPAPDRCAYQHYAYSANTPTAVDHALDWLEWHLESAAAAVLFPPCKLALAPEALQTGRNLYDLPILTERLPDGSLRVYQAPPAR